MINYSISEGYQIHMRHQLLLKTIGTRQEEDESHMVAIYLNVIFTTSVLTFSLLEALFYLLYNSFVS